MPNFREKNTMLVDAIRTGAAAVSKTGAIATRRGDRIGELYRECALASGVLNRLLWPMGYTGPKPNALLEDLSHSADIDLLTALVRKLIQELVRTSAALVEYSSDLEEAHTRLGEAGFDLVSRACLPEQESSHSLNYPPVASSLAELEAYIIAAGDLGRPPQSGHSMPEVPPAEF